MATTRLSTKGQLILPKELRDRHGWEAGTVLELVVRLLTRDDPDQTERATRRFAEGELGLPTAPLSSRERPRSTRFDPAEIGGGRVDLRSRAHRGRSAGR